MSKRHTRPGLKLFQKTQHAAWLGCIWALPPGARPSSGAASLDWKLALRCSRAARPEAVAAPGDGRAPLAAAAARGGSAQKRSRGSRLDAATGSGYKGRVKLRRLRLRLFLLLLGGLSAYCWWLGRLDRSQNRVIGAAAARYGVDPALVKAVVWRESRFHPRQRGRAGEIGLMQLQEVAAQPWADAEHLSGFVHEDCLDPATNTMAGTFYLKKLLTRYPQTDNPIPYALADYNAGRGNVVKWTHGAAATNSAVFLSQIGFPMTRRYVKAVMHRQVLYHFLARIGWE